MQDYFGTEIKYGDYLIYPNRFKNKEISMLIVKVDKFYKSTIGVKIPNWCGKREYHYVRHPERTIVITEEVALNKQPLFKDLK